MKVKHIFLFCFIFSLCSIAVFAQIPGTAIKGQKPNGFFDWVQLDSNGFLKAVISGFTASLSAEIIPNTFTYYQFVSSSTSRTIVTPPGTVGVSVQIINGGSIKWMLATSSMTINDGELVTWYAEEKIDSGVNISHISSDTSTIYVIKFKRKL